MATEQVYLLVFGAVALIVVVVAVLLLAIQRLRRRKAQLLSDLQSSARLDPDRSFNRLAMARREAEIVGAQGTDVTHARELIARSQSAFDLSQFDRSYELAQSAHETLVSARLGRSPTAPSSAPEPMTPRSGPQIPSRDTALPLAPASASGAPLPAGGGLPRNRVESQFEMRMLDSDLERAQLVHPAEPATRAAVDFQSKAQAAFAAEQYTEAFRYALKGRRGLGGNVERVALGPAARAGEPLDGTLDPNSSAERAASAARCPHCGYPTTSDDVFCRGCGTPRAPAACPRCGTARTPADTFCGRCGERFS
ncbi:MAG: zinc ribbon domain-containing protein [Thermoplasmata archaeon]